MRRLTLIQSSVAATVLCFSAAWAQQDSQSTGPATPIQPLSPWTDSSGGQQPRPAAVDASLTQNGAPSGTAAQAQPDTHLLSSAETLGLGSLRGRRHMFDPALQFSEFSETGLVPGRATAVSNLGGSLDMSQQRGRYNLTMAYKGADIFYQPSYYGLHHAPYDDFSISPEVFLGRWTLRLRETALYSWQSSFGGLFTGGPAHAVQSGLLSSIQPSLAPNGTIQTGLARQLNNTVLGEADYSFGRRTTLTVVGSYGLLHFLDPGYINSQSIVGRVGYDYALSAANSVSLSYDFNRTSFGGAGYRMQTDLVQMSLGRKITGRLAFQLGAGPQVLRLENVGSATRQLSWNASSAVTYNLSRTGYSLSYFRGVTAGSGVFFGSKSETITGTANHKFTPFWSASVNGGYALNDSLVPAGIFASRFDNWFAFASLNRQMGRHIHWSLSYGFQRQTSGAGSCPVLSCGLPGSQSFRQFGANLQWHPLLVRAR